MPCVFGSHTGEGWKDSAGSAPAVGREKAKGKFKVSRFGYYHVWGRSLLLLKSQVAV